LRNIDKIPRWKLSTVTLMENSKAEKQSWGKENKQTKNWPEKERKSSILSRKKMKPSRK